MPMHPTRTVLLFCLSLTFAVSAQQFAAGQGPRESELSDRDMAPWMKSDGALFLVGGGRISNDLLEEFYELGKAGVLVLIPGASKDAETEPWSELVRPWNRFAWKAIHLWQPNRSFEENETQDDLSMIRQASAVWIGGGDQNRLVKLFRDIPIETELQAILARGGVIGTTSAGTAIATRTMISGGIMRPRLANGWDLLPNAITDQHFSERRRTIRLDAAIRAHGEAVGVGIDEGTALLVKGGEYRVMGRGKVHLLSTAQAAHETVPCKRRELLSGSRGNWPPIAE